MKTLSFRTVLSAGFPSIPVVVFINSPCRQTGHSVFADPSVG